MPNKYILVFILFGVAALILLFPAQVSTVLRFLRLKRRDRTVQFADSISLTWGRHFWEGRGVLPAWAGFQQRLGPYASTSGSKPSAGEVQLSVSSPEDGVPTEPSEAQEKAFRHVRQNDAAMRDKVLKAVFDAYPERRETYKEFLGEDFETQMPVLKAPADLKSLIGLSTIHILAVEKDGLAYLGFEFGCEWEEEHGLGVMSHGDRIIEVGSAEEAFSTHIASQDRSRNNG
jgi:hypothetical protein